MKPCVVSAADHAGWAHVLVVAAADAVPAVVARRRIALIEPGLPTMPYHHESLGLDVEQADRLIARVRESVDACARRALHEITACLMPSYSAVALSIRHPTYPALPDSVAQIRTSYALQCAADGMMYTLALCAAAHAAGLEVHQCRRGEEVARAAASLRTAPADVTTFVTTTGRPPGPPWADEHRRAFAAGIAALACHAPTALRIHGDVRASGTVV
ncbi:MAG: hypothetical protein AB7N65_02665 [Vicinamibacterales bacterium]